MAECAWEADEMLYWIESSRLQLKSVSLPSCDLNTLHADIDTFNVSIRVVYIVQSVYQELPADRAAAAHAVYSSCSELSGLLIVPVFKPLRVDCCFHVLDIQGHI